MIMIGQMDAIEVTALALGAAVMFGVGGVAAFRKWGVQLTRFGGAVIAIAFAWWSILKLFPPPCG